MTEYTELDILYGELSYARQGIPTGNFILKKDATEVVPDDIITINSTYKGTPATQIFDGRIEDVDMNVAQGIYCIDKAQELIQHRPVGNTNLYSDTIAGKILYDYCNIIQMDRTPVSTFNLYPASPDITKGNWDDYNGNDNDILWDDLSGTGNYISTSADEDLCELTIGNHSLSGSYHYEITEIDIEVRHWMNNNQAGRPNYLVVKFFDGTQWLTCPNIQGTDGWHVSKVAVPLIKSLNEDDLNNIKIRLETGTDIVYDHVDYVQIEIKTIYRYDSTQKLKLGTEIVPLNMDGNSTILNILNILGLTELRTWYHDPNHYIYLNDGDIDSTYDLTNTDKVQNIIGKRKIKSYDKIILNGGYVGGGRITASAGSGNIVAKETYNKIFDQTILDNLAIQLLTEKGNNQFDITLTLNDATEGLFQVGETIDIGAGIKFSGSDITIPTGVYVIDEVTLFLSEGGAYDHIDIKLIDFLIFSIPEEYQSELNTKTGDENATAIDQISTQEGAGEANTGSNIGGDGEGVYHSKSGVTLQFRRIAPASGKITVTLNGSDIDLDVVPSEFLENPPIEDEANKAPTSEWAFDHKANVNAHHSQSHNHDSEYYTETEINNRIFEQTGTFPVSPVEGDFHYDEDLDSLYRYNGEAEAWVEIGVSGGISPSIDNLGNHTATEDLDMDNNNIINVGNIPVITLDKAFDNGKVIDGANSAVNSVRIGEATDHLRLYATLGRGYIGGYSVEDIYFWASDNWNTVHADDFTPHSSPMPIEKSTEKILLIKNNEENTGLDYSTIPIDTYYKDKNNENEGYKMSRMMLHLIKTIQELENRIKDLEAK